MKIVTANDTNLTNYEYNSDNQLLYYTTDGSGTVSFTYDDNCNQTHIVHSSFPILNKNYQYDYENRMLSAGTDTFAYDLNGNMTEWKTDSGVIKYDWDYENMLVTITDENNNVTRYNYYGDGKRYSREIEDTITVFVWNAANNNVIAEYDDNNNQLVKYGQSLQIDQQIYQLRNSNYFYYHFDGPGSVQNLTADNVTIQNSYSYKGFGEISAETETVSNEYKFTSRRQEKTLGLYYYRMRFYNPLNGRFITQDPHPFLLINTQTLNRYVYVLNNPLIYTDPLGLSYRTNLLSRILNLTSITVNFTEWKTLYQSSRQIGMDHNYIYYEVYEVQELHYYETTIDLNVINPIGYITNFYHLVSRSAWTDLGPVRGMPLREKILGTSKIRR
jgi:RHS repeat-associated protein